MGPYSKKILSLRVDTVKGHSVTRVFDCGTAADVVIDRLRAHRHFDGADESLRQCRTTSTAPALRQWSRFVNRVFHGRAPAPAEALAQMRRYLEQAPGARSVHRPATVGPPSGATA